jgi:signal transduction histidine kinase
MLVVADAARRSSDERWSVAASAAATLATALAFAIVVGTAGQDRYVTVERLAPRSVVGLGVAGCAAMVVAAWLLCRSHPLASVGLAFSVAGLLIPSAAGWTSMPVSVRAACLAALPLAVVGIGWIAQGWDPGYGRIIFAIVGALSLAATLLHLGGYDPFDDTACARVCVDFPPVAGRLVSTRLAIVSSQALLVTAVLVLLVAMLSSFRTRPLSVTAGAVVAAAALGVDALRRWLNVGAARWSPTAELLPSIIAAVAIGAMACVVAVSGWRTRVGIERVADRLAEPQSAWFGRPVRGIHVAIPDDGRWVDLTGREVSPETEGVSLVLTDESGPAIRLLLAPGTDPAEVRAGFSPVTWFALLNARLAAIARARVLDVTASRRRVVAAADAERRRIERDLHDGAQQRLVSAAFYLSLARRRSNGSGRRLVAAERNVQRAVANLRELSHGVFPRAILTEGLPDALEDLVRDSGALATLQISGDCSMSDEAAHAVYATVLAALAAARSASTPARVTLSREGSRVVTRIVIPSATPPDLTEVEDRVGAADGRLSIEPVPDGTLMAVELPCG